MITNNFLKRHNGVENMEIESMLKAIGLNSLDELIDQAIPQQIRMKDALDLPQGLNEMEYLNKLKAIGARNKVFKSYIGQGYYSSITPGVIQRNILENPGWYTAYTPYQAEISQGRLEALLNFQTMVSDLTGMELANASLLDEATAAAEAMIMSFNARSRAKAKTGANKFFVAKAVYAHTLDVIETRAKPLGIEVVHGRCSEVEIDETFFGVLLQYPNQFGMVKDYSNFVEKVHENELLVCVAADLLSLTLLTPPGEWGADIVVGSTQRFGIPLGFGGPHAAFFATSEKFKRHLPGRIIGVSVDIEENPALRMALQTREQHIKRERATSNICTSQVLLAVMAGMYAVYHGPNGLRRIAEDIHQSANFLSSSLKELGYKQLNDTYFDTIRIQLKDETEVNAIKVISESAEINLRYISNNEIGISVDETTSNEDLIALVDVFEKLRNIEVDEIQATIVSAIPENLKRTSDFMTHDVFHSYRSETNMMRYIKSLEIKDLSLNRSMIPLGSCTMKLNAAAELFSLSWPEFANIHPFVPKDQANGYYKLIEDLECSLKKITGFAAVSFQPNSGASGEYAGMLVIQAYHQSRGDDHRNICLIPASAHGTNPASAVMAGMKVVVVKTDDHGNIDFEDLKIKAEQHKENLSSLMVTYPSTHGVFEDNIMEVIELIHQNGGQVYMDGANMNAQVGLTNPGIIGADVCHLNLHKTFAIPHGGGGPGVGPIGVANHLVEFLPGHKIVETGGENAIQAVSAAPFGSAFILPISYGYIQLLGGNGLTEATKVAILSANYLKTKLQDYYPILYTGNNGWVAHEMILDCHGFKKTADVEVIDIAKRLMDYGFHAPTVAFPVHGTLMVEPTESEPLDELDRFVEAMIQIRTEIKCIEEAQCDPKNNVLKNSPHTIELITADEWNLPYERSKAAFPVAGLSKGKYWPTVRRINDAFGDRNLVCSCAPIEDYMEE